MTLEEIKDDFAGKEHTPLLTQFKLMFEARPIFVRSIIPTLVMFGQQWTGTVSKYPCCPPSPIS